MTSTPHGSEKPCRFGDVMIRVLLCIKIMWHTNSYLLFYWTTVIQSTGRSKCQKIHTFLHPKLVHFTCKSMFIFANYWSRPLYCTIWLFHAKILSETNQDILKYGILIDEWFAVWVLYVWCVVSLGGKWHKLGTRRCYMEQYILACCKQWGQFNKKGFRIFSTNLIH
jgi:hypothetical protein